MPTEEKIRAFLLGNADEDTEKTIEEGILDGSMSTDELLLIEEELIDDHVFGSLSGDEERSFQANFLLSQERREKLKFSRALREYARKRAVPGRQGSWLGRFPRLIVAASFAVTGVAAVTVVWVGIRDGRLSRELAVVSQTSDERQRLLQSLEEEKRQRALEAPAKNAAVAPAESTPAAIPAAEPAIQLRPGVKRGVEAEPVLAVPRQAGAVRIMLELGFQPAGGLREDLLRASGERLWTQELPSAAQAVAQGMTTIYLPAQLLPPGDYRIRVKDLASDASDEGDVYAFRVSRR